MPHAVSHRVTVRYHWPRANSVHAPHEGPPQPRGDPRAHDRDGARAASHARLRRPHDRRHHAPPRPGADGLLPPLRRPSGPPAPRERRGDRGALRGDARALRPGPRRLPGLDPARARAGRRGLRAPRPAAARHPRGGGRRRAAGARRRRAAPALRRAHRTVPAPDGGFRRAARRRARRARPRADADERELPARRVRARAARLARDRGAHARRDLGGAWPCERAPAEPRPADHRSAARAAALADRAGLARAPDAQRRRAAPHRRELHARVHGDGDVLARAARAC